MPTIDELDAVIVASDDDTLPVSQSGKVRRVSRSQLLAGTQATLALTSGLLGRTSAGLGGPERIAVGGGLSLANGVLSGTPQYSPANLPILANIGLDDIVPVSQSGHDRSVTVKALLSVGGADISGQVARSVVGSGRCLGDWLSDAVAVEAFGAIGDGIADDSAPIGLAIASGRPVLLGPKTYRVDGQWDIQIPTVMLGTPGLTALRRGAQHGGAWINISASSFVAVGVTFDAGSVAGDSWGVLLAPACTQSVFRDCTFSNATGKILGSGLTIQARDGLTGHPSSHSITDCVFRNNACHGLWIQAACGAEVRACRAFANGGFGINLDFNDPSFQQTIRQSVVANCKCWNNTRGISVGNYNALNQEPPRWGLEYPDATDIVVSGNMCSANTAYGIAVSGDRIQVINNIVVLEDLSQLSSGILCNASLSTITYNTVVGPGGFGIDAGGSVDLAIISNTIKNCAIGINAGGSKRVRIAENDLVANGRSITIFQVETDGHGANFGIACSDIWIEANRIQLEAGSGGIYLLDGPERVEVLRNRFISTVSGIPTNLCWAHADSVKISQNSWNGLSEVTVGTRLNGTSMQLIVPDVLDFIAIDASATEVDVIVGQHQADMTDRISFLRVINGGTGYTQASVVFAGSGTDAAATVYIRDGSVIGIAMASSGSGYDAASTTAIIKGDGQGAIVMPIVGVPLAQGRQLTLRCSRPVRFLQNAGQANWTNADIIVPPAGQIIWQAIAGTWHAAWFNNVDYLQPGGDGSVSIKSAVGDIRLHPALGGGVRFGSDLEATGFLTLFGRGSPEGNIVAPPGSDYRNLDGGVGKTLWLKRSGSGNSGWAAIG